jgi:Transglycosylase SLT domain/CHAP domain
MSETTTRGTGFKIAAAVLALFLCFAVGITSLVLIASTAAINAAQSKAQQVSVDCSLPAPGLPAGVEQAKGIPAAYRADLAKAAKASGIPAAWLAAQIQAESNWNPNATSPVGAMGLTQFMPGTWAEYGKGSPTDPHAAIAAQGRFMAHLYDQAKGSGYAGDPLELAFAGYNAGWGNVQVWAGIPPFPETRNYVAHIKEFAKAYGASDAAVTAAKTTAKDGCDAGSGTVSGKDDYPWADTPYCPIGGTCPDGAVSVQGFFNRECVDFAMWRVNQQLGSTGRDNLKYLNGTFRGDGEVLGHATTWLQGWEVKGWPTGTTPKVGAVVYYVGGSPAIGGGSYGHVAIVKEVLKDGTFIEEGYNMLPNDHRYYTAIKSNTAPTRFLYLPEGEAA